MELTAAQIQQIDNYISACGIKYYDVRMEIVDHFASKLEERLDKEPNLNFREAIIEEHKKFSRRGFQNLLAQKEKATQNRFIKMSLAHLKTFFKLPKVIVSVSLYVLFYQIMKLFENKETFFEVLVGVGFSILIILGLRMFLYHRKKREKFLILNRTKLFYQVVNNMFLWFHLLGSFRSKKSYFNNDYNIIHLAVFILLILVYWSMEHVYQQNRKEVQKQYPNVIV